MRHYRLLVHGDFESGIGEENSIHSKPFQSLEEYPSKVTQASLNFSVEGLICIRQPRPQKFQ